MAAIEFNGKEIYSRVLQAVPGLSENYVLNLINQDALKRPGFSDLIQGIVEFSDTIVNIPGSGIDLMASGSRRSDLTDLTTTTKLKEFFDQLKKTYDYIILDTPPIQPVSDTLFISQATDHNFIIARAKLVQSGRSFWGMRKCL